MTDLEKWKKIKELLYDMTWASQPISCPRMSDIRDSCDDAIAALEPKYRTPTDEDALERPTVEYSSLRQIWSEGILISVREGHNFPFIVLGKHSEIYTSKFCRMKV